jgi:diguanylate cyclase (GGDEF)-like protein
MIESNLPRQTLNFHFEPNSILAIGGLLSLMMGLMLFVQAAHLRAYRTPLMALCLCLLSGALAIFLAVDERGLKQIEIKLAANFFGSFAYVAAMVCFSELYKPKATKSALFTALGLLLLGTLLFSDLKLSYVFNQSVRIATMIYTTSLIFRARDRDAPNLQWFALAIASLSAFGMMPQLLSIIGQSSEEVMLLMISGRNATLYQSIVWAVSPSITYTCVTSVIYARVSQQLRQSVYFDMLTGAHSRRYLIEEGTKVIEERRRQLPIGATSLLMIDVDHFKKINDEWGHVVGDSVLKHCVSCIMNVIRTTDAIVGRYGGEEFCVVLPDTPMEGAGIVAERLRSHIAETPYMHGDQSISITISAGIALQEPSTTFSNLLSIADQRLYLAKKAGRNTVIDQGDKATFKRASFNL